MMRYTAVDEEIGCSRLQNIGHSAGCTRLEVPGSQHSLADD